MAATRNRDAEVELTSEWLPKYLLDKKRHVIEVAPLLYLQF